MYAIVETGGEQVRISEGDTVRVNKIDADVNTEIVLDKVLMLEDSGKAVWGAPYVKGASVKVEIVGSGRYDKILVLKTTPKKAHNKIRGHRQQYTTVKIKEITKG
ncbi:MAG TPA: 50S ribosomal protein L21 [Dissulfurispiraceae bacterium]|nr:50S ribosomal protein L21 [Dissulfurispiraceae bacterium]